MHASIEIRANNVFFIFQVVLDAVSEQGAPCVRRHVPVSARGETHRADLRPVRHTGAFELLVEEAADKCPEPFKDGFVVV